MGPGVLGSIRRMPELHTASPKIPKLSYKNASMVVGKSEIFDTWYVEVFYLFSMEYLLMEFLPIL